MIIIVASVLLIWQVDAVRVSPKLDFGDSNVRSGFRQDVTGYTRGSEIAKREQTIPTQIICTSNNCNTTNTGSEKENGVSTDVLVHIKTNVDLDKTKNDTTIQNVPDVPIVLGTKTSTAPAVINNRPINTFPALNYPPFSIVPPLTTNNVFIPSTRPTFIQNQPLQSDSQVLGYPNFITYAPQFQDNNNALDFQNIYFRPPINSGSAYRPISSTPIWNQNGVRRSGYNPVEFRKTYTNQWSPVNLNRNKQFFNSRLGGIIPRWTPCVCEHPLHQYPTSSDDPAGISGKLSSLN